MNFREQFIQDMEKHSNEKLKTLYSSSAKRRKDRKGVISLEVDTYRKTAKLAIWLWDNHAKEWDYINSITTKMGTGKSWYNSITTLDDFNHYVMVNEWETYDLTEKEDEIVVYVPKDDLSYNFDIVGKDDLFHLKNVEYEVPKKVIEYLKIQGHYFVIN